MFRLARDGWLQSEQIGRRSYYSLSDDGREKFDQATHRIYGSPAADWDGQWCLLLMSGLETAAKEVVRKECGWLGFGAMSANVLAHPLPDLADLDVTIQRLGVADQLVVVNAQTIRNEAGMRRLAHDSWNLADLDERYREFVATFRPLMAALQKKPAGIGQNCVHCYGSLTHSGVSKGACCGIRMHCRSNCCHRDWPGAAVLINSAETSISRLARGIRPAI